MSGTYPSTVCECLDPNFKYRRGVVAAVKLFADSKPWRGSRRARFRKIARLHSRLCAIYGIEVTLMHDEHGHNGRYSPVARAIVLEGPISVVTYLHEFGHAVGHATRGDRTERFACRWSLNLFRRYFPRSFSRASQIGHRLVTQ